MSETVAPIPDEKLLERAVKYARRSADDRRAKAERWVHVRDVFGLGSTSSQRLCRRFGIDPFERVN